MGPKYTHMLPNEELIWDAYIEKFGLPEGRIKYDVHLGEGAPIDAGWSEWMRRMVKMISTHRADVIIERPGEVVIVEIKRVAGMGALGQLVGYEALYVREHGVGRHIRLVCVCEVAEADIEDAFGFYEIELIKMGELGERERERSG